MKHYGIWIIKVKGWMVFGNGDIFNTTCLAVAQAQIDKVECLGIVEIREFV